MNQKWPRHVALRKRVLDELIIDVWTETNEHEENAERQKHEQTVILKNNSGWKTLWRTTTVRERKPPGNKTGCATTPFHQEHGKQQRTDTSCNTLRPTLQNDSNFTAPSLTKRNMCFLMCPCMTRNTVPLGGDADSHTIQLTAPPSQHLIEQARTTTGRHSVALATPTLRRLHREKEPKRTSSRQSATEGVLRWTHHRRLQWRNTLTNKQTKRIRSKNRKYDIET